MEDFCQERLSYKPLSVAAWASAGTSILTEAGKGRAAKVAEDRKKTAADVFSALTEEEKAQLAVIFGKLTESLDQQFAEKEVA